MPFCCVTLSTILLQQVVYQNVAYSIEGKVEYMVVIYALLNSAAYEWVHEMMSSTCYQK